MKSPKDAQHRCLRTESHAWGRRITSRYAIRVSGDRSVTPEKRFARRATGGHSVDIGKRLSNLSRTPPIPASGGPANPSVHRTTHGFEFLGANTRRFRVETALHGSPGRNSCSSPLDTTIRRPAASTHGYASRGQNSALHAPNLALRISCHVTQPTEAQSVQAAAYWLA